MADEYIPYDGPIVTRKEARLRGLKRYFSGVPCKYGHVAERFINSANCIECHVAYMADPTRGKANSRKHYTNNRDSLLERQQVRNAESPDKRAAISKASRTKNGHKWLDKQREAARLWSKNNPEACRAHSSKRRAVIRSCEGSHTGSEILSLFAKQKAKCANCKISIKSKYHADHIKPLCRGGSNWISNIQLLCPTCNQRKHAKDPIQWAQENGRLL